jgi:large subunit ribosomal protein L10
MTLPNLSETARSPKSGGLMDRQVRARETGMPDLNPGSCPGPAGGSGYGQANMGNLARRGPNASGACPRARPGELETNVDRTQKRDFVAGLHDALADTSMIVVTHNTGLTVAEATDLRRRMRTAGVTFKVAKNRLAHLALEGTRFDGLTPMLKGPTALAWSTDPVAAAKATVEFARTNDKLVLIGGALGAQMLDASGVRALAELPSLDTLRARLVWMISTPATRVAGVLQGSAGQLARVFGAFARKSEGEAAAA